MFLWPLVSSQSIQSISRALKIKSIKLLCGKSNYIVVLQCTIELSKLTQLILYCKYEIHCIFWSALINLKCSWCHSIWFPITESILSPHRWEKTFKRCPILWPQLHFFNSTCAAESVTLTVFQQDVTECVTDLISCAIRMKLPFHNSKNEIFWFQTTVLQWFCQDARVTWFSLPWKWNIVAAVSCTVMIRLKTQKLFKLHFIQSWNNDFSIPFLEHLTEQFSTCAVAIEINNIKMFFAVFVILLPMLNCIAAVFHILFQ